MCRFQQWRQQEIKDITETEIIEHSDTDKTLNKLFERKQGIDRRAILRWELKSRAQKKNVDTGSLLKYYDRTEKQEIKNILPRNGNYQDVNKNEANFFGKITVEADNRKNRTTLRMLITERDDSKRLLDLDWLPEFKWAIQNVEHTMEKNRITWE